MEWGFESHYDMSVVQYIYVYLLLSKNILNVPSQFRETSFKPLHLLLNLIGDTDEQFCRKSDKRCWI